MNKILVVDDDASLRMLYADELTEEGYEVVTTGDGSKLMELIDREGPDLIVMDIKLGSYNGLDLLQDIRNTYYDLPVILCTAYPAFKYKMKAIAADYYVVKNSTFNKLKLTIKMALEGGRHLLTAAEYDEVHGTQTSSMEQMMLPW